MNNFDEPILKLFLSIKVLNLIILDELYVTNVTRSGGR